MERMIASEGRVVVGPAKDAQRLQLENGHFHGTGDGRHPAVVAGQRNRLATRVSLHSVAGGRRSSARSWASATRYRRRSPVASIVVQLTEKVAQWCHWF